MEGEANTENYLIVISVTTPLAPPLPPYPPTPSVPHRCRLWSMRNSVKAPPINQAVVSVAVSSNVSNCSSTSRPHCLGPVKIITSPPPH